MTNNLSRRLLSGLSTVKGWDSDKELLKECRDQIPFHLLCPDQYGNFQDADAEKCPAQYVKPDDDKYQGDDLLLKRLTLYFQKMMTWVNNPPCELCGSTETKCRNVRGPLTFEEKEGQASRVEVYWCSNCNAETTLFPRYNNPKKLLETKKGRCGEYANLFGLYCRAAGFDTRYVLDFTDHVWTEVYSHRLGRWIMCDSCEGQIDAPSMYEHGWGKNLNCILGFTTDSVTDVTRRYTRKFKSNEFQDRRREICPEGELQMEMIIAQFNSNLRHTNRLSRKRIEELDKRLNIEMTFLQGTEKLTSWDETDYSEGRSSGALAWRIARGEAGRVPMAQNHDDVTDSSASITTVQLSKGEMSDILKLALRSENDTVSSNISMRLPDDIMPLATQVTASIKAKMDAFLKFIKEDAQKEQTNDSPPFIGFCTKHGLPIYLITKEAYPFKKIADSKGNEMIMWKTFHFVPSSLSGEKNNGDAPTFDVPVNEDFFMDLTGSSLLKNQDNEVVPIPTMTALTNARLVAFYFSAHWCPPCRRFTPMLCELYLHLKSAFPTHGLELIFVSSDRDPSSFKKYFSEMPWLALPYDNASGRRSVSQRFGVQGIPALVVLDTISGNIVISKEASRSEVSRACQGGDDAIEEMFTSWLDQVPLDSKEMMETLKLSCAEEDQQSEEDESNNMTSSIDLGTKESQSARIKEIFDKLVNEGLNPTAACVQAIEQVAKEVKGLKSSAMDIDDEENLPIGRLGVLDVDEKIVLLVLKYLGNIENNLSTPKYRVMRLANKVFDQITASRNGLRFIEQLGFQIFNADHDFVATVPLAADIESLKNAAEGFLPSSE